MQVLKTLQTFQVFCGTKIRKLEENHSVMQKDIQDLKNEQQCSRKNYQTTFNQLEVLKNQVAKLSLENQDVPYLFMLPDRTEWFSGREYELEILRNCLQENDDVTEAKVKIASVCGLGGSGKTSLAAEYAHRWKEYYAGGVFWFAGENESVFANSVDEHAVYFGTRLEGTPDRTFITTLAEICKIRAPWLLVLDDMDEYKLSKNTRMLLSGPWKRNVKGTGHILITTRRNPKNMSQTVQTVKEFQCLQLECFTKEDGNEFVFRRTGLPRNDETSLESSSLVELLGGLPLAMEQACAYIHNLSCSLSEYLEQYKRYTLELLDEHDASSASVYESPERLAVRTTWLLNFKYIKQSTNGEFATRFLNACAFFNPKEIQEELINPGKPPIDVGANQCYVNSPLGPSNTLKVLTDFSLFKKNKSFLVLHRLVQEVIRDNFSTEEFVSSLVDAVRFLSFAFSRVRSPDELLTNIVSGNQDRASLQASDPSRFYDWHMICIHAHEVKKFLSEFLNSSEILDTKIAVSETARLVYECALHLNVHSKPAEAKEAFDFAYEIIRLGDSLSTIDLADLFPHEIPLPDIVRKFISYSCVAPHNITEDLPEGVKDVMSISEVDKKREEGNFYFKNNCFAKAAEVYTFVIDSTKETNSFDPTFLTNRASAYIRLGQFSDALKDAEEYISYSPDCHRGYARKAVALYKLNKLWDAACAAALAYYFKRNIFDVFKPFKDLFISLKDRVSFCDKNDSLLRAFPYSSCHQDKLDFPRKIIILEPGDYEVQSKLCLIDYALIGVKDTQHERKPHLHLIEDVATPLFHCMLAQSISFAFDEGCRVTNSTFLDCHFSSKQTKDDCFASFGETNFTNCHFENCKGNGLSIFGKTTVEKCIFSANRCSGVQVFNRGELEIKLSEAYGNTLGIHIGPNAGTCCITDCKLHDNRYHGIRNFLSPDVNIIGNQIYENDHHGIYLEGSSFTIIEKNEIFENCWNGISTMDNARCNVMHNKVYGNRRYGVQVVPVGPGPKDCCSIVKNNEIFDNRGEGIRDKMVFRDQKDIPKQMTLEEHEEYYRNRKNMRKAKIMKNKMKNNGNRKVFNESDGFGFCSFCRKRRQLEICSGCYFVGYCGELCKENDTTKHNSECSSYLEQSSIVVKMMPKTNRLGPPSKDRITIVLNEQAPNLDPKGPDYAEVPKDGERFLLKVQAADGVRQSNLGSALLVIYDRTMTIHGELDYKTCPLYRIVQECGENSHGIGWTKMFFWAMFCSPDDHCSLRIFTKGLPPYQNW